MCHHYMAAEYFSLENQIPSSEVEGLHQGWFISKATVTM